MTLDKKTADDITAELLFAVGLNPKLGNCDIKSLLLAGVRARRSLLPPLLDYYYFIPRNIKGIPTAMYQVSYRGLLQMAYRTGLYKFIDAKPVRDGEYLGRDEAWGEPIVKFYKNDEEAKKYTIVGYTAVFVLYSTGLTKRTYWTKEEIEHHRDRYSPASKNEFGTNLWRDDFEGMALKTVLGNLIKKWGVMTPEIAEVIRYDGAVETPDGKIIYPDSIIDDEPDNKEKKDEPKKYKDDIDLVKDEVVDKPTPKAQGSLLDAIDNE
jgi:recombination protein RecT